MWHGGALLSGMAGSSPAMTISLGFVDAYRQHAAIHATCKRLLATGKFSAMLGK
jgi:hypothetical protein